MDREKLKLTLKDLFEAILVIHPEPARADDLRQWMFTIILEDNGTVESVQNTRLATAIAFEALTGNILPIILFDKILERKDSNGDYYISSTYPIPAHRQFHKATIFEIPTTSVTLADAALYHQFYETNFQTAEHPKNGYVRCINFSDFHEFYITKDQKSKYKSFAHTEYMDDHQWDEDHNFHLPFPEIPIENNVNMRGGKPLAWIAPVDSIAEVFQEHNPPVELAQRLGIFVKSEHVVKKEIYNDVLVGIHYTKGFSDKVYQPGSVHADWISGGFVSYKENDLCYGMTYNCSVSGGKNMPERIHIAFPIITVGESSVELEAIIIGRVDEPVILDFDKILTESFRRFEEMAIV